MAAAVQVADAQVVHERADQGEAELAVVEVQAVPAGGRAGCGGAVADLDAEARGVLDEVQLDHGVEPGAVEVADGEIDLDDRQLGLALVGALMDDLRIAALEGGGSRTSFWLRRGPELPPPLT